jgi:Zn finger protein HypA/HybF involved in hydrogenase expression
MQSPVRIRYNEVIMWPFKRKRAIKHTTPRMPCPYCKSKNTKIVSSSQVVEEPDYTKTWRGKRYVTCKCLECGQDFYIESTLLNIEEMLPSDESIIENEDALTIAEEELKRQADEENDHRFKRNM